MTGRLQIDPNWYCTCQSNTRQYAPEGLCNRVASDRTKEVRTLATETESTSEKLAIGIPEVARLLGISRNSAYEAARQGILPTIVIGRRILVPVSALKAMLAEAHH